MDGSVSARASKIVISMRKKHYEHAIHRAFNVVSQFLAHLWHSHNSMLDTHLTTGQAINKDNCLQTTTRQLQTTTRPILFIHHY